MVILFFFAGQAAVLQHRMYSGNCREARKRVFAGHGPCCPGSWGHTAVYACSTFLSDFTSVLGQPARRRLLSCFFALWPTRANRRPSEYTYRCKSAHEVSVVLQAAWRSSMLIQELRRSSVQLDLQLRLSQRA